jgi:hypothetical protein
MIASRSFLFMCDHHINNPQSESWKVPSTYPTKNGETIYIHPTALRNFVDNYLPLVKFNFILLSGDSDTTVPHDVFNEARQILQHPLLIRWYSQNCTAEGKLFNLPIGLDFHTLERGPYFWGPKQTIESQVQDLQLIRNSGPKEKLIKCYSNFHFLVTTRYGQDRIQAIHKIDPKLVYYEPQRCTRNNSWNNMVKFKYVISPHGNGLDCHRTWEALFLGCIPILKTSTLDPMFKGLPVLIVQDWSEVTQELLNNFIPDYSEMRKLELSYWKTEFTITENVVS